MRWLSGIWERFLERFRQRTASFLCYRETPRPLGSGEGQYFRPVVDFNPELPRVVQMVGSAVRAQVRGTEMEK